MPRLVNDRIQNIVLTLSQTTNFRLKLKEFADDNFTFDENGRKFSRRVENIVGKGEIACYGQFLLFPQCFQDLYCRHIKTRACLGKVLKEKMLVTSIFQPSYNVFKRHFTSGSLTHSHTTTPFDAPGKQTF